MEETLIIKPGYEAPIMHEVSVAKPLQLEMALDT
jgi:hypothetical protein